VRANTAARIRIDGNEGWTVETARELMPTLRELGVEFVEQPFPAEDLDSFRALRELPDRLPVIVDEGCRTLADVAPIATYADGVNIKLAKAGGLREALRMIHAARALGLQVMLGCMIESELGIAHAAQVAPLVDHVDLDGHLLLADSPFRGLGFADGRLVLADRPGLGVEPA
jgi:L-alanine-DL-glutamate epimerase-like enolase superfamily enzyme